LVDVGAVFVGGFAHVDARVLGVRVENVQRHETEVVHRPETMTYDREIIDNGLRPRCRLATDSTKH